MNRWSNEGDAIVVITSNGSYGKMTIWRGSVRPVTGDDACKLDYDAIIRLMFELRCKNGGVCACYMNRLKLRPSRDMIVW